MRTRRFTPLALALAALACESELPTSFAGDTTPDEVLGPHFAISQGASATAVNGGSGGSTLTILPPAGVAEGNFLVAQITFEKGADVNNLIAPPGWMLVERTNSININSGTDLGQAIFYRVAAAAEPTEHQWQFRKGSSNEQVRAAGGITRFAGVNLLHPNGPIVGVNEGAGDGTTLTVEQINTLEDAVVVAFFGHKKLTALTDPSGMTNLYERAHSNQSGPTIRASMETRTADGPTGSRTSNASQGTSDKWIAQLVGLRSNTKPVYTPPDDQEANEGAATDFDLGTFIDPDNHGSWEITVDWGDGTSETFTHVNTNPADPFAARSLGTREHTYVDNLTGEAPYTITVTVDDGTDDDSNTFQITVRNVAPTVVAPEDPQSSDEGEDKAFNLGSFSDPGVNDADWTVDVDWGDSSTDTEFDTNDQGGLTAQNHTYVDNGTYTVTVTVTDKDGGSHSASFDVTVANKAPVVDAAAGQSATAGVSKAFDLGSFSDAGVDDDPWSVNVDWGDGSADDDFDINAQGSLGTRSHTYASAGTYTVTVMVTDKDGASHSDTFQVMVTAAGLGTFYLHNNPPRLIETTPPCGNTTRQANLPMNAVAPGATTLCNYDTNGDAFPGRLIQKGGSGAAETDLTKFQTWRAEAPAGGMTFSGNVNLTIFAGMIDFTQGNNLTIRGFVRAFLRDCPASGSCTLIASASLDDNNWHEGVNAWIQKTLTFASVPSTTIVAGRFMELKIIVDGNSGNDMWFAYDTANQPARLIFP